MGVAPYLSLMAEEVRQTVHPLREVFNGLRWTVRPGAAWRMMPDDLPPWEGSVRTNETVAASGSV